MKNYSSKRLILGPKLLVDNGKLSFPSGHSAAGFLCGTYAFLLLRTVCSHFYRPLVLAACMVFPMICAGRLCGEKMPQFQGSASNYIQLIAI